MKNSKKHISTLFILLLLCSLTFLTGCKEEKQEAAAPQMPPTAVVAVKMKNQNLPIAGEYMGKALGFLSVEVRAQIPGILLKRHYKEGSFVEKGQLLFEIDPSQAEAALNQANAGLAQSESTYDNAKKEWERIIPLYQKNAVSQKDRDQAESAYLSAKANVEAARAAANDAEIQLGYTKVVAPISGYTSLQARNEGNLITLDTQGSLLTVINQTDPMYVVFAFPGADITRMERLARAGKAELVGEGATVSVKMMDGADYPHKGTIDYIDTQIDPLTNSLEVKAVFPNPDGGLIPNMYTTVSVEGASLKNVMVLPQNAVLQTAKGPMVYTINDKNTVDLVPLTLGDTVGSLFVIDSGLKEGDVVVITGVSKIYPGSSVNATMQEDVAPQAQVDSSADLIDAEPTTDASSAS